MMDESNLPTNQVVKTSEWVITMLITAIPLVGVIMLFVWAFSGSTNPNKANWAKAALIWMAIGAIFMLFWGILFGAAFFSALQ